MTLCPYLTLHAHICTYDNGTSHVIQCYHSYFTKDTHPGVSVFRRRRTAEHGQRGFRLSALGVLLARSSRPRPWLHVDALNTLIDRIYATVERRRSAIGGREQGGTLEPSQDAGDWEPARAFFEERVVKRVDLRGAGQWRGWSYEMDNVSARMYATGTVLGFLDISAR